MKRVDLVLPLLLLTTVLCILVPLPVVILDILLSLNLLFAVLLFVGALHIKDPLEITGLPSLLLLAALVRLSLNLATTRSILSTGHAGELVATFGGFVVGGNLVVGLVLFILLTIVQFLVVAKGSERVAEVSARFTLDALPGKQMSIDADVRAGLLDTEGARKKRQDLQTESRFYGALDGAMKFVKGDAIAGIIITAVNLVGGFSIGILMKDLSLEDAVRTYSLLSIGDGLLSQLPSLLNAVAAGMVVTRVGRAENGSLSSELSSQLGGLRAARIIVSCVAAGLAAIPGMPYVVLSCIAVAGLVSCFVKGKGRSGDAVHENSVPVVSFDPGISTPLRITAPLELLRRHYTELVGKLQKLRADEFARFGVVFDAFTITPADEDDLNVAIYFHGAPTWRMNGSEWNTEVVVRAMQSIIESSLEELLDDAMTRRIVDLVERKNPEIVTTLIPATISITQLTGILKSLISENVPIHGIEAILQVAAEIGAKGGDRRIEAEARIRLRRSISARVAPDNKVNAHLVHPIIDLAVSSAEEQSTMISESVYRSIINYSDLSNESVVICGKRARPYIRDVLRSRGIHPAVVAREELLPEVQVTQAGSIELDRAESEELLHAIAA